MRNDLEYFVPEPQIINARDFGVPQNRERIYIVGFRKDLNITEFTYPKPTNKNVKFATVKEEKVPATKYFLSTQYVQTLINKYNLGVTLKGRAFCSNLFVRTSQKGFPLQSLTQNAA